MNTELYRRQGLWFQAGTWLNGPDTEPAAPSGINKARIKPGPRSVAVIDAVMPDHPSLVGQLLRTG